MKKGKHFFLIRPTISEASGGDCKQPIFTKIYIMDYSNEVNEIRKGEIAQNFSTRSKNNVNDLSNRYSFISRSKSKLYSYVLSSWDFSVN